MRCCSRAARRSSRGILGLNDAAFDANKQISFAWSTATPTRWSYGDRTARCYMLLEGNLSVSRSLRGNGNVPI